MNTPNILPLALGLLLFSFSITSLLVVPFIDLLYKLKLTRKKEAPLKGKIPLFDKLHDIKAGTPVGGGILIILVVTILFTFLFPWILGFIVGFVLFKKLGIEIVHIPLFEKTLHLGYWYIHFAAFVIV